MSVIVPQLTFWVPGAPKTKGSMNHIGRGRMVEAVAGSSDWRKMIAERARQALGQRVGFVKATSVLATFQLAPPAAVIARGEEACYAWVITQASGDVDKLSRNLLDALQDAQVVANDSQVIRLVVSKSPAYGQEGEAGWPGVRVLVMEALG